MREGDTISFPFCTNCRVIGNQFCGCDQPKIIRVVAVITDFISEREVSELPLAVVGFPHVDPCACGHDHTVGREGVCGTFLCDCRKWTAPKREGGSDDR